MKLILNFLFATYESIMLRSIYGFLFWLLRKPEPVRLVDFNLILENLESLIVFDYYWWLIIIIVYSVVFKKGLSGKMLVFKIAAAAYFAVLTALTLKHSVYYPPGYLIPVIVNLFAALTLIVVSEKRLRTTPLSAFKF